MSHFSFTAAAVILQSTTTIHTATTNRLSKYQAAIASDILIYLRMNIIRHQSTTQDDENMIDVRLRSSKNFRKKKEYYLFLLHLHSFKSRCMKAGRDENSSFLLPFWSLLNNWMDESFLTFNRRESILFLYKKKENIFFNLELFLYLNAVSIVDYTFIRLN